MTPIDNNLFLFIILIAIISMLWGCSIMIKVIRAIMPFWSAPMHYTTPLRVSNNQAQPTKASDGISFGSILLLLAVLYLIFGYRAGPLKVEPASLQSMKTSMKSSYNYKLLPEETIESQQSSQALILGDYALQLGAFESLENAERKRKHYQTAGHPTQVVRFADGLYRTLITPEHADTEADIETYAEYYQIVGIVIPLKDA